MLLVAALMLVGCGGSEAPDATPSASSASSAAGAAAGARNLLLITLDTLRADRLGAYGYAAAATPEMDRLAAEGARFERVTTTVPVTLPAHASIMTGRQPFEHGVRNNGAFILEDNAHTLAEVLRENGYSTGGFIGTVVLGAQFGMAQGFDAWDGLAQYQARTGDESGERPGEAVVAAAEAWMETQTTPWFAWVHMYDPHDPYEPPEPFAGRFADAPYDGEVAYVDAMVGRLRRRIEAAGFADDTLVVVTADHGEGLGDHGERGHAFFVYDTTVRVPLILWGPGVVPAGVVSGAGASVVDLFPTVLSLLGVAPAADVAAQLAGVDLTPLLREPDGAGHVAYAESLVPYLDFGWSELRALVDGDHKYIAAPEPELYDLAADPGETRNLVDVDVERADAMADRLADLIGDDDVTEASGVAVDAGDVAALQALGYLAGGGSAGDRRDIDPKDMMGTYETFVDSLNASVAAIDEGRFGDANDILVELDELVADSYIVHYYFGRLALEAGDPANAVVVLERALELNPSYLPTYTMLANALHAAGDSAAALELVEQGRAMFPDNFALTLLEGAIAHDSGDFDAALATYREASRLDADNPALLERLGHLHLLRQEPADAVAVMRRLVEVTPDSAAAWAQLAIGLAQSGNASEAQSALDRALEIDPLDPLVQQIASQLR